MIDPASPTSLGPRQPQSPSPQNAAVRPADQAILDSFASYDYIPKNLELFRIALGIDTKEALDPNSPFKLGVVGDRVLKYFLTQEFIEQRGLLTRNDIIAAYKRLQLPDSLPLYKKLQENCRKHMQRTVPSIVTVQALMASIFLENSWDDTGQCLIKIFGNYADLNPNGKSKPLLGVVALNAGEQDDIQKSLQYRFQEPDLLSAAINFGRGFSDQRLTTMGECVVRLALGKDFKDNSLKESHIDYWERERLLFSRPAILTTSRNTALQTVLSKRRTVEAIDTSMTLMRILGAVALDGGFDAAAPIAHMLLPEDCGFHFQDSDKYLASPGEAPREAAATEADQAKEIDFVVVKTLVTVERNDEAPKVTVPTLVTQKDSPRVVAPNQFKILISEATYPVLRKLSQAVSPESMESGLIAALIVPHSVEDLKEELGLTISPAFSRVVAKASGRTGTPPEVVTSIELLDFITSRRAIIGSSQGPLTRDQINSQVIDIGDLPQYAENFSRQRLTEIYEKNQIQVFNAIQRAYRSVLTNGGDYQRVLKREDLATPELKLGKSFIDHFRSWRERSIPGQHVHEDFVLGQLLDYMSYCRAYFLSRNAITHLVGGTQANKARAHFSEVSHGTRDKRFGTKAAIAECDNNLLALRKIAGDFSPEPTIERVGEVNVEEVSLIQTVPDSAVGSQEAMSVSALNTAGVSLDSSFVGFFNTWCERRKINTVFLTSSDPHIPLRLLENYFEQALLATDQIVRGLKSAKVLKHLQENIWIPAEVNLADITKVELVKKLKASLKALQGLTKEQGSTNPSEEAVEETEPEKLEIENWDSFPELVSHLSKSKGVSPSQYLPIDKLAEYGFRVGPDFPKFLERWCQEAKVLPTHHPNGQVSVELLDTVFNCAEVFISNEVGKGKRPARVVSLISRYVYYSNTGQLQEISKADLQVETDFNRAVLNEIRHSMLDLQSINAEGPEPTEVLSRLKTVGVKCSAEDLNRFRQWVQRSRGSAEIADGPDPRIPLKSFEAFLFHGLRWIDADQSLATEDLNRLLIPQNENGQRRTRVRTDRLYTDLTTSKLSVEYVIRYGHLPPISDQTKSSYWDAVRTAVEDKQTDPEIPDLLLTAADLKNIGLVLDDTFDSFISEWVKSLGIRLNAHGGTLSIPLSLVEAHYDAAVGYVNRRQSVLTENRNSIYIAQQGNATDLTPEEQCDQLVVNRAALLDFRYSRKELSKLSEPQWVTIEELRLRALLFPERSQNVFKNWLNLHGKTDWWREEPEPAVRLDALKYYFNRSDRLLEDMSANGAAALMPAETLQRLRIAYSRNGQKAQKARIQGELRLNLQKLEGPAPEKPKAPEPKPQAKIEKPEIDDRFKLIRELLESRSNSTRVPIEDSKAPSIETRESHSPSFIAPITKREQGIQHPLSRAVHKLHFQQQLDLAKIAHRLEIPEAMVVQIINALPEQTSPS